MDTWEQRFEDLIFEVNGHDIPSIIRKEELAKVIQHQLADDIKDAYVQVSSQGLKPNTLLMTEELWEQLINDPNFSEYTPPE